MGEGREPRPVQIEKPTSQEEKARISKIISAAEPHFLYPHDISIQYWRYLLDIINICTKIIMNTRRGRIGMWCL